MEEKSPNRKSKKKKFRKLPTNINEGNQNYNISYNLPDETQGNSCLNVVDKQIVFIYLQRSNKKLLWNNCFPIPFF